MSRHQEKEIKIINEKDKAIIILLCLFISKSPERTKHKAPFEANKGQGLCSTK